MTLRSVTFMSTGPVARGREGVSADGASQWGSLMTATAEPPRRDDNYD